VQKKAKFVCSKHLSTKALLTLDGIAACTVVEGSMMKELFLNYLEFTVVCGTIMTDSLLYDDRCFQLPKCSAYPGPLSMLVMDNAWLHHCLQIPELCDHFGE